MEEAHVVRVTMKPVNSRRITKILRKNNFNVYLVNTATGEYEVVNEGVTILKAASGMASQNGYLLDCYYNGTEFPSQDCLKAIASHEGVIYFKVSRGDNVIGG